MRRCYTTSARLYRDSPFETPITWQWCLPSAKPFPFPIAYGSGVWDWEHNVDNLQIGEVRGSGITYVDGDSLPLAPGTCFMGTASQWGSGPSVDDPVGVKPDCCQPFWFQVPPDKTSPCRCVNASSTLGFGINSSVNLGVKVVDSLSPNMAMRSAVLWGLAASSVMTTVMSVNSATYLGYSATYQDPNVWKITSVVFRCVDASSSFASANVGVYQSLGRLGRNLWSQFVLTANGSKVRLGLSAGSKHTPVYSYVGGGGLGMSGSSPASQPKSPSVTTCSSCSNGAYQQYQFTISGVTNNTCTTCTTLNNTWTLTYLGMGCTWQTDFFAVCNAQSQFVMLPYGPQWELQAPFLGTYLTNLPAGTTWDCQSLLTFYLLTVA